MKTRFRIAALLICCAGILYGPAPPAAADKIFLKDGKVYEGTVVGKSDRRYLFGVKVGEEEIRLSFFLEEVDHVDMEKDSAQRQIPYLKEVEDVKFDVGKEQSGYELSLYKKEQKNAFDTGQWYTLKEIEEVLGKEEFAYYQAFGEITQRYAPKFVIIDTMYADLSVVTKDDFETAKVYMRELYEELSGLKVPPAFQRSYETYREAVKATSLSFDALDKGALEEAARQTQVSQENRAEGMKLFREVVQSRRQPAEAPRPPAKEERPGAAGQEGAGAAGPEDT